MDQEVKDTSVLTKGTEDHSSSVDIFEDEKEEEAHNVMNDTSAPVASSQETKDENITQDEVDLTESIETSEVDEDEILGLAKPSEETVSLEDDNDDDILLEDTQDSSTSLSGEERAENINQKESELLKNKDANGDIITTFSKSITFPKSGKDEKKSNSDSLMTVGSTSRDNSNEKEHDMSDAGTDFDQEEFLVIDESSNDREDSTNVPVDVEDVSEETKSSPFTSVASTSISKVLSSSSSNSTVTPNQFAQKDSTPLHIKLLKKRKQKAISATEFSPEGIETFRFPFKHGWKREVVNRNVVSSGKGSQCDIYYFTPQGKKLRSMVEIETWLSEHEAGPVRITHFSFARTQLFEPPHEIVRDAGKSRRNPISDTPKPKQTLTKKVEKRKETPKETGLKRVLVTPLGANKNQYSPLSAMSVVAEGSNSIARSSPKIKFVPMVHKTGIISALQKKLAKHGKKPGHTFLNKSSRGSPDWEPSDSDSEEREQHSSIVRNVEVIKYSASDEPSGGLGGKCDELQNVLGTPSKLISSIVNPKPPPPPAPVAPVPIILDAAGLPTAGVRFQILAMKNAKPEEIFSQLGLGFNTANLKYRVIKPNEAMSPHTTVPTRDVRVVMPSQVHPNMRSLLGQRMPQLQQRPNSSLLQLAISSPTGVQPLKVLPSPPPLASRPGLPTPVVRTPSGKVIYPTLLPAGSTANPTTTTVILRPPPLQTAMMRPTNPPPRLQATNMPPPRLQATNMPPPRLTSPMSLATKSSHPTIPPPLSLPVSKTVPPPSTSSEQNSSLPTSKTTRSSTDDLVDKIYNDLPHFLGLGTGHHNTSTVYSSNPSLRVPGLLGPTLSKTDFRSPHYNQSAIKTHGPLVGKRSESLLEALDPLNSSFLMDEHFQKSTGAVAGGNNHDIEDTDNIDSSLPISFDSMDKDGSSCPTPVDEMEDTSDKGSADSTDDNSKPTLSCKSYLLFKLVQDNYPVMLKLFEHLPMYDLLRASRVCKQWHRLSMMSDLWQHVEIDSVFHDNWDKAVKFFIKVGVKSLKITKLPDASKPHTTDAMVKALNKMNQLKVLQFDVIHQHTVARILETMPHLENVGAEHIIETEPLANSTFVWSSFPKELAMAQAVDAVATQGKLAMEAATMYGVPEAELKHLMLSDKSALLKQEEDAVLLCSMRLSSMGFPINETFLETRLQEEISKRPKPCQQSSQMTKRICERLLRENQHLFKQKLPYRLSDPVFRKLISYSSSLHRLYETIGVEKANSVYAFYMKKVNVLNFVGNRLCQVTALSVLSAANYSLPIMLIFSNGIRRQESVSNLILVNSKDGLVTPNLISHYLRECFSQINKRPLVLFFKGDENIISHQLVSDCINGSVFLQCVPQDISEFAFPGYHGGVLNSVSEIMKGNLVKENDFITLIREEMRKGSNNMSNVFAKTGLFPVKQKPDNSESEEDSLPEEGSVCNGESSTQEEGIDKENLETNKGDDPFQQQSGHVQNSTSPPQSVLSNYGSALTQYSDVPNDGDKGTSLNRPFPGAGRRQKLTPRKKRSPFVSSLLNTVKTNVSLDTSDMNGKKSSLKRPFTVVHEMDAKAKDSVKKSKISKDQPVASMSSIEESINQVIAKSLEETDAKEKEVKAPDEINDNINSKDSDINESTNIPMRPSLKIRRSAQGLVSVLNSEYPKEQISEEDDASDEEEDDKEEDSEVEEEEEEKGGSSSYEEMEIVEDDDGDAGNEECDDDNNNNSDEAEESKTSVDQQEKEGLDSVSSDMSDESREEEGTPIVEGQKEEAIDTSRVMEDDSDNESPEKRVKKMKKKKKKSKKEHSFSKDNEEQSENENDKKSPRGLHKKKKKEKKRKKAKRREEEKPETFDVLEISSPKTEPVTANLLDKEEDEKEKKLIHIRRTSKVDHDYETKFDSDSGTEVVTEDSILKIQVESEEPDTVAEIDDCNENTVVSAVSMPLDDKTAEEKDETSDSSSSSCSSSDSDNENGSNERGSGSGSAENSGSSSSCSDSDQEDVEEDNPTPVVKDVRVPGEVIGKVGDKEPTDLNEKKSSSGDEDISDNSESDDDENEEGAQSDEGEEEEKDDDGNDDEDSNCQLCMLSNPPHTKDTIIDWVDCDGNCGRWFHVICINRSQAKANLKHYICPSCRCKR